MRNYTRLDTLFHNRSLANNVPLFHFERKSSPVRVHLNFDVSNVPSSTTPGLVHFVEHMLLAGTKKYPTKDLLIANITDIGGDMGARTTKQALEIYFEVCASADVKTVVSILNEILNESLLDPVTIERERTSIFSEIEMYRTNQMRWTTNLFYKTIFPDTVASHDVVGTVETVATIKPEELNEFYKNLCSMNPTFIVSGDISIIELEKYLSEFTHLKHLSKHSHADVVIKQPKSKTALSEFNSNKVSFMTGFKFQVDNVKEFAALHLAQDILTRGRTSRLVKRLRYESGLVYSVYGGQVEVLNNIIWSISTSGKKDHARKIKNLLLEEINKFISLGITKSELDLVKNYNERSLIRKLQTSEDWITENQMFLLSKSNFNITKPEYVEFQKEIDEGFVNATIKKYFNTSALVFVAVGNNIEI